MKRYTITLLVDSVSFVGFVLLTSTGVLLHYLLPPGSGRSSSIWGLNRHEWGDIHFYIAIIFFGVLSVHLFLHWRAILNLVKGPSAGEPKLRLALGLVGLITVLLLAIGPLVSPTSTDDGLKESHRRSQQKAGKQHLHRSNSNGQNPPNKALNTEP